jgi:hypothetical protein
MKAVEARCFNSKIAKTAVPQKMIKINLEKKTLEAAPLKVFEDAHQLTPRIKSLFEQKKIRFMAIDLDETLVVYGDKAQEATYFLALLHCFIRPSCLNEQMKEGASKALWDIVADIHEHGQYHRLAPESFEYLNQLGLMSEVRSYLEMDEIINPVRADLVVPALLEAGYLKRADGANRLLCALMLEGIIGRLLTMTPKEPAMKYIDQLIDSDVGKPVFTAPGATFGDAVVKKKPELYALEFWCGQNGAQKHETAVIDDTLAFIENCLHGGVGVAIWRMTPKAAVNPLAQARALSLKAQYGDRLVIVHTLDELTVKA